MMHRPQSLGKRSSSWPRPRHHGWYTTTNSWILDLDCLGVCAVDFSQQPPHRDGWKLRPGSSIIYLSQIVGRCKIKGTVLLSLVSLSLDEYATLCLSFLSSYSKQPAILMITDSASPTAPRGEFYESKTSFLTTGVFFDN